MPDMVIKRRGAAVVFSTSSDDFSATLRGPGVDRKLKEGDAVETRKQGFYTVAVADAQVRELTVTLTATDAESAQPRAASKQGHHLVAFAYRVK